MTNVRHTKILKVARPRTGRDLDRFSGGGAGGRISFSGGGTSGGGGGGGGAGITSHDQLSNIVLSDSYLSTDTAIHLTPAMLDEIKTGVAFAGKLEYIDGHLLYEGEAISAGYADESGYAAEAGHAKTADDISIESPVFNKFLRKDVPDTAKEKITFEKGIDVAGGATADRLDVAETAKAKNLTVAEAADAGEMRVHKLATLARAIVEKELQAKTGIFETLSATSAVINLLEVLDQLTAKNASLSGVLSSQDYVEALLGWIVRQDGSAELKSLVVREFLEATELRYNRVSVVAGEVWNAPGGGIVESVDAGNQIITLKLEPGEMAALEVDDICKAIFNNDQGFVTSFFRITEKIDDASFKYVLRPGYSALPQKTMHFVAYGNFTNPDRQASSYSTRSYKRYLRNVNTWEISDSMIMMQMGDLSNLRLHGISMTGYSGYLKNIYLTGTIKQISADGVTETPVPAFKGEWSAGTYYPNDEVTHNGGTWLCIADAPTTEEPKPDSPYWLEKSAKGKDALTLEVFSTHGNLFHNGKGGTTLSAQVRKGETDITTSIPDSCFSWTRTSANPDTDTIFNEVHAGYGPLLEITPDDVFARATFDCIVSF